MSNISITFSTNKTEFLNDYMDIVRAFYPYICVQENANEVHLSLEEVSKNEYFCIIEDFENIYNTSKISIKIEQNLDFIKNRALLKRYSKVALYNYFSHITGVSLPYGSLTGIRPTKLFHDMMRSGENAVEYFEKDLRVSKEKTKLIQLICHNQQSVYKTNLDQVDLFVNIPICVSRCSYCSFLSAELGKIKKWVQPYCDLLCRDIKRAKDLIGKLNKKVRCIYVGGGTPTSFTVDQLGSVLSLLSDIECQEFTVEAGRPDTIDEQKLDIMAKYNVNRISINPQTFNQTTLDKIGRKHTVQDIFHIYELARKYDFDINMDLIAMLPDESFEDFKKSVDTAIELSPENITVHTLAMKRGSNLKLEGYDNKQVENLPEQMVDYSYKALTNSGYEPYYMYKQKYMSGNLENIGYCKANKKCVYNIDIMEETHSIVACGAGGISKRLFEEDDRLERLANPKGIDVYLSRDEENFDKRDEFFLK